MHRIEKILKKQNIRLSKSLINKAKKSQLYIYIMSEKF